jgi:hypothetical protein
MTEQEAQKDTNYTHLIVQLTCGTVLEITQPERYSNFTITAIPKPGIPIGDFADMKNDKLNVRLTEESLIGLYQTLQMIVDPRQKQKTKSLLQRILEA